MFFSRILEMKGRLEIGRRLLKSFGSNSGFLRKAETTAVLKVVGTIPGEREEWMMAETIERREQKHCFTRTVLDLMNIWRAWISG